MTNIVEIYFPNCDISTNIQGIKNDIKLVGCILFLLSKKNKNNNKNNQI